MSLLDRIRRSSSPFSRSVIMLMGGAAGAQLVLLLASPVLTRLYTPADFGLLSVYVSLLALFLVVASFRYELAIPLPGPDSEAFPLVVLSMLCLLITVFVAALLVIFFSEEVSSVLSVSGLNGVLWLLPIGVFLGGVYQIFTYWAVRRKDFGAIAQTRIRQNITIAALQIIGFKFAPISLLAAQAGGQSVGSWRLAMSALKRPGFKEVKFCEVWKAAKRYKKFPIFSTWSGLANTAGSQLPTLLLAALFSPVAAGLYGLAQRVLSLPMQFIGDAIGKAFLSYGADDYREGRLALSYEKITIRLVSVSFPAGALIFSLAPDAFQFVFGSSWREAGVFASIMMPMIVMQFITSPLSTVSTILERQGASLIFQIVLLLVRVLALILGSSSGDVLVALICFSVGSAAVYFAKLVWTVHIVGARKLRVYFSIALASLFSILVLFVGG